jgi:hypothetical protein
MACEALAVGLSVGGKTFDDPMVSVWSGVFLAVDEVDELDDPQAESIKAPLATKTAAFARCRSELAIPPPLIVNNLTDSNHAEGLPRSV